MLLTLLYFLRARLPELSSFLGVAGGGIIHTLGTFGPEQQQAVVDLIAALFALIGVLIPQRGK